MNVDEALQALGAVRAGALKRRQRLAPTEVATDIPAADALESVAYEMAAPESMTFSAPTEPLESEPAEPAAQDSAPAAAPVVQPSRPVRTSEDTDVMKKLPQGLVVGAVNGTLFTENPFANVKSLDEI